MTGYCLSLLLAAACTVQFTPKISVLLLCSTKKGGLGGMFGMLKGLVGSKSLTRQDMDPVLEKMKDHLIGTCGSVCGFV